MCASAWWRRRGGRAPCCGHRQAARGNRAGDRQDPAHEARKLLPPVQTGHAAARAGSISTSRSPSAAMTSAQSRIRVSGADQRRAGTSCTSPRPKRARGRRSHPRTSTTGCGAAALPARDRRGKATARASPPTKRASAVALFPNLSLDTLAPIRQQQVPPSTTPGRRPAVNVAFNLVKGVFAARSTAPKKRKSAADEARQPGDGHGGPCPTRIAGVRYRARGRRVSGVERAARDDDLIVQYRLLERESRHRQPSSS